MIYLTDPEKIFPTSPEDGSAGQVSNNLSSSSPPTPAKGISGMAETGRGSAKCEPSNT